MQNQQLTLVHIFHPVLVHIQKFYRAPYATYSGEDAASKFIDHIISEVNDLRNTLRRREPMQPLSTLQQQHYSHANQCYLHM